MGQRAHHARQPVGHVDGRVGVVDTRRQRPRRHLGQRRHRMDRVHLEAARCADRDRRPDRRQHLLARLFATDDTGQGIARLHESPHRLQHEDLGPEEGRTFLQGRLEHLFDMARLARGDGHTTHRRLPPRRHHPRALRRATGHVLQRLARTALQQIGGIGKAPVGIEMDDPADDRHHDPERDTDRGEEQHHKLPVAEQIGRPQDHRQKRIEKRPQKGRKDRMGPRILAQQHMAARRPLPLRPREARDHDRQREGHHRQHRACQHRQDRIDRLRPHEPRESLGDQRADHGRHAQRHQRQNGHKDHPHMDAPQLLPEPAQDRREHRAAPPLCDRACRFWTSRPRRSRARLRGQANGGEP